MDWTTVSENWQAFVAPIQQRWPRITEEDLIAVEGNRDRLTDLLSAQNDLTKAEAEEQIAIWLEGGAPADVVMDESRDNANIRASAAHIGTGEDVYADDRDFGDDGVAERPIGKRD